MSSNERLCSRQSFRSAPEIPRVTSSFFDPHSSTSWLESRYGNGSSSTASTRLNTTALAPMPSASDSTATAVQPGDLRRSRRAKRKSVRSRSMVSARTGRSSSLASRSSHACDLDSSSRHGRLAKKPRGRVVPDGPPHPRCLGYDAAMRVMLALALAGAAVLAAAPRPASVEQAANAGVATPSQSFDPGLGAWTRLNGDQPILSPRGDGFEAAGVFNPAVVRKDGGLVMLYRAQDATGSRDSGMRRAQRRCDVHARGAPVRRRKPSTSAVAASRIRGSSRSTGSSISPTPRTTARTRSWRWPRHAICVDGIAKASFCRPTRAAGT